MPTILPLESLSISPRAQGQHKRDEYFRCSVNPQHRHISRQFGIISSEQCNAMKYLLQLVYDKIPRSRLGDFMVPLMKTRYWPLLPENTGVLEEGYHHWSLALPPSLSSALSSKLSSTSSSGSFAATFSYVVSSLVFPRLK